MTTLLTTIVFALSLSLGMLLYIRFIAFVWKRYQGRSRNIVIVDELQDLDVPDAMDDICHEGTA